MKKVILFFLGVIISQLAFAQYFDWVKVYKGSEADGFSNNSNQILNVKTDSFGNSYFVGCCAYDAGFNGERFLPITPNGPFCNTICTVIGKISSDGDLLWSKVIHANNNKNHSTKDIFILGDTALACFINVLLPTIYYPNESLPLNYLYYLDTLIIRTKGDSIVHNGTCLFNQNLFSCNGATAYIVFDLDGNIIEEHWLTLTLLNTDGHPFTLGDAYPGLLDLAHLVSASPVVRYGTINVDQDGNINIIRSIYDNVFYLDSTSGILQQIYIANPKVSGWRFYIDSKRSIDLPLPECRPSANYNNLHNYQLLKFSPHFDSLLENQFLIEPTPEHLDTAFHFHISGFESDNDNNLYLTFYDNGGQPSGTNTLQIGGSDSLFVTFAEQKTSNGFLVKYDSSLNPVYLKNIELTRGAYTGSDHFYAGLSLPNIDDKGDLILRGSAYSTSSGTRFYIDSTEIESSNGIARFFRFRASDGKLLSYTNGFESAGGGQGSNYVAAKNRFITQIDFRDYMHFADTTFSTENPSEYAMGFAVMDYSGKGLLYVDYGTIGRYPSTVILQDSVLYLTGMLNSNALFGDISVPMGSYYSQAYIAKYVDRSLMTPYTNIEREDIQLVVRNNTPLATIYPNPCRGHVTIDCQDSEQLLSATLTDAAGRQYAIDLTRHGDSRYAIDIDALPSAVYLLTLTTESGHKITSRLLKR